MKRKLSLLMVLMMVVALVPANLAFAASDSIVNTIVTSADGTVDFDLDIEAKGTGIAVGANASTPAVFELRLDGDAEWVNINGNVDANGNDIYTDDIIASYPGVTITTIRATDTRAEFQISGPITTGSITVRAEVVLDGAEGEQKVTVEDIRNSGISRQVLTYAVVSGDGSVISRTLEDDVTLTRGTKDGADFELREATKDAIDKDGTFTLRLPKDVEWAAGTTVTLNGTNVAFTRDGRDLDLTLAGTSKSFIDRIIVSPVLTLTKDAKLGDISVQVISGTSDIDADDVVVGTYKDYNVLLEVDEVKSIIAGKDDTNKDYVATITLNQTGNSLIAGRPVDFTVSGGDVKLKGSLSGSEGTVDNINSAYDDEFTLTVSNTVGTGDIEFDVYLKADWDASGELSITGEGAGMEEQTLKLADVLAPATISTKVDNNKEVADVVVGLQNQMAPDLIIEETEGGSLTEGFYILDFGDSRYSGVEINEDDIEYEVEGDLSVDDVYTIENDTKLVFEVDGESSNEASTLTISGIKVTLDRTVPFGNLDLRFGASILDDSNEPNDGEMVDPEDYEDDYTVEEIVDRTPYLNIVTAVQDQRQQQTVFMIDSVTYMVGTETRTLDAAPFISMNRTMLPMGTVANLVGATVNYSAESRTAVFTKDNLVVSMNLDTNVLLVNGSPVMMDAKPMIVNSRAFVPVVYVAQAFGIQNGTDIVYDAAQRTVTLFPEVEAN